MRTFTLTAAIWKEGRRYVSKCPELGVASFGVTPAKALDALREAVTLYLANAKKLGILGDLEPVLTSDIRFSTPLQVCS
ncbi:MAG: type II toxin-antitoxin system HicB family antitoxin [Planctomycetes bacterium]|nr:type II toxin-antitoxin system HicB family antitoxin [Planctomycetota bacterium]